MILNSGYRVTTAAVRSSTTSHGTAVARSIATSHQRRPSSSKANIPPNEDEGKRIVSGAGKETKAAKSAPSSSATTRKSRAKSLRNASLAVPTTTRAGRESFVPLNKLFPDMPEPVRATNHLKKEDVFAMQFFAGHLPLSPSHIIPPSTTDAQFDALFNPRPQWQKYKDTTDTLSDTIQNLTATSEEAALSLDSITNTTDPLAEYYRTNRPPPPPVPVEDLAVHMTEKRIGRARRNKAKSWQTTITVTEWTDGKGQRTYRADSSPITRIAQDISSKVVEIEEPTRSGGVQQPFLERMRLRQEKWQEGKSIRSPLGKGKKPGMFLISVRRQRKAKMKKHKLKKLRKRTRNLRRKLGKL